MGYWLLKTEPSEYSYDDLEKDGTTVWDGVTNNLALKHIRSFRKGDFVFIYHTGNEKQIVGVAQVTSPPHPDPNKKDPRFVVLELKPNRRLQKPVALKQIKALKEFAEFELVRLSRLSVMPVDKPRWDKILHLSIIK